MKKILSVILCAALLALTVAPAFAADDSERFVINDPELKSHYLSEFNDSVNAIKSYRPACSMTTSYNLGEPIVSSKNGGEIDDNAQKWVKWIIDACFKSGSGMANTLFSTIFGDTTAPKQASFAFGEIRNNRVPVSGKDYVSGLTDSDKFSLLTETTGGSRLRPDKALTYTKIVFPDVVLDKVGESSLGKIFNLTNGALNPVIASNYVNPDGDGKNVLDGVTFEGFTFTDPTATAVTDSDGKLVTYITDINYSFSLSLDDFINMVSATTGVDFMAVVLGIANTILTNTGKGALTPGEILNTRYLYIVYNVHTELTDFGWDRRSFGDADGKNGVTIEDARMLLRHAIGIQPIRNKTSLIYADLDFDGDVTVADARLALRTAIGLDEEFTYVPDGKKIKIVEVAETPVSPDENIPLPKDDDEDKPGEEDDDDGRADLGKAAADMTQAIMDIVNGIRGTAEGSELVLDDLIEFFKHLNDEN